MPYQIEPLRPEALPELGRFLADGFGSTSEAEFVAPEVLRWKYLDPLTPDDDRPRSFVARDETGRIIGHVGLRLTHWRRAGSAREVATSHMIDWLGSISHRGVGLSLFRTANRQAETQYGIGGSAIAQRVGTRGRGSYETLDPLPVYRRVLRPGYRLRVPETSLVRRAPLAVRDAARLIRERPRRPSEPIQLRPVERFGDEVDAIAARCPAPLLFTGRRADELNLVLDYPRADPSGWLIESGTATIGFALLNVVAWQRSRIGKVVDLFLDRRDPRVWGAAFAALAVELKRRGADVALACGGPPWESEGLRAAGFRHAFDLGVFLRDPDGLLPREPSRHLGFLEGDYAFIP